MSVSTPGFKTVQVLPFKLLTRCRYRWGQEPVSSKPRPRADCARHSQWPHGIVCWLSGAERLGESADGERAPARVGGRGRGLGGEQLPHDKRLQL